MNFPAHPGSQAPDRGQVTGPLFPFGFGLSYTTFGYANLRIRPDRVPAAGPVDAGPGLATAEAASRSGIAVWCDVTNTGTRAGDEVVQLYLRDDYSSVTTFEKVLRGFARVALAPGETRTVQFTLTDGIRATGHGAAGRDFELRH